MTSAPFPTVIFRRFSFFLTGLQICMPPASTFLRPRVLFPSGAASHPFFLPRPFDNTGIPCGVCSGPPPSFCISPICQRTESLSSDFQRTYLSRVSPGPKRCQADVGGVSSFSPVPQKQSTRRRLFGPCVPAPRGRTVCTFFFFSSDPQSYCSCFFPFCVSMNDASARFPGKSLNLDICRSLSAS